METFERFTPYALSVVRVMVALLFMQHGMQKLLLFPTPSPAAPTPWTIVWFAGLIEALGGALMAAGLLTRVVAFVAAGEMAVAYWMVYAPVSFFPVVNKGDLAVLFCFVFLLFVFTGPGAWSGDAILARNRTKSSTRLNPEKSS